MKLDRNICSKCGEKNFRDEDFIQSFGICKECYENELNEEKEEKVNDFIYLNEQTKHTIWKVFLMNLFLGMLIFYLTTVRLDFTHYFVILLTYFIVLTIITLIILYFFRSYLNKFSRYKVEINKEIFEKYNLYNIFLEDDILYEDGISENEKCKGCYVIYEKRSNSDKNDYSFKLIKIKDIIDNHEYIADFITYQLKSLKRKIIFWHSLLSIIAVSIFIYIATWHHHSIF